MALLPPLEWRKLPVRIIQSASLSTSDALNIVYDMMTGSIYYDGSTRIAGSGSAWTASGRFVTGSALEAFWCYPPLLTSISQSIMFAGKSTAPLTSSAASPYLLSGSGENSFANTIHMAHIKNASSSFTQWTSQFPFGSGSASSGYIRAANTISSGILGSKFVIYESKEALAFMHYTLAPNLVATIAGAVIDPEQTDPTSSFDAEVDGRIYGIIGSSAATQVPTPANSFSGNLSAFLTAAEAAYTFLSNFGTLNSQSNISYSKFYSWYPNTTALIGTSTDKYRADAYINFQSLSGRLISAPLKCYNNTSPQTYLGRLRDIAVTKRLPLGEVVRDFNGTIIGYTLSATETGVSDTVVFNHY